VFEPLGARLEVVPLLEQPEGRAVEQPHPLVGRRPRVDNGQEHSGGDGKQDLAQYVSHERTPYGPAKNEIMPARPLQRKAHNRPPGCIGVKMF